MYASVTEKLEDPEYLSSAIQTFSSLDMETRQKEKKRTAERIKVGADDMTDEGARCYIDRYPDLDMFNTHFEPADDPIGRAKLHWADFGKEEGRNPNCAPKITDQ